MSSLRWKACLLLLAAYVTAYLCLSRASERILKAEGVDGFLYAPVPLERIVKSPGWQWTHQVCARLFYPLWLIDHALGGPQMGFLPADVPAQSPTVAK